MLHYLLGRRYCYTDGFEYNSPPQQNVFPSPQNYSSLFCARLSHNHKATDMTLRTFMSHATPPPQYIILSCYAYYTCLFLDCTTVPSLIALHIPNLTFDSESHDSLDNINQTLINEQGWTVGLLPIQIARTEWHTITLVHPE